MTEEEMFAKYPITFERAKLGPRESCMGRGMECGPGWYKIIDELAAKIENYNQNLPEGTEPLYAEQIKEKFGGLRFYTSYCHEEIDKLISEAERLSYKICEQCGDPGTVGGKNWISTMCTPCRTAYDQRLKEGGYDD